MLYVNPAPSGAVMVMVPVATAQLGWVSVAVGAGGVAGAGLTVSGVAAEVQPAALRAVTL
jgi:hypothetical protein